MVVQALVDLGVDTVFGYPGGAVLPIYDALYKHPTIKHILVRHEQAATHAAEGYARSTGKPGVVLVTSGPGATNAVTGIANAHVSRVPVLVLSGAPPRPQENRGALQDMDHPALLHSITRYARRVREPALVLQELDEAIARAFGEGGEPGPVFLDFPTDVLRAEVSSALPMPVLLLLL